MNKNKQYDIVIYGGTAAGIVAAVQASVMDKSVIVIEPSQRIGGLTTGGLGDTDVGMKEAIGGLSLEFYRRVARKYSQDGACWLFEPKVALEVLQEWVVENNIEVVYGERLELQDGVTKEGSTITSIRMESGNVYRGKMFIDASYEGDLMGKSRVSYFVGRESNAQYGETLNGIHPGNELPSGIDPYVVKGVPSSGLLLRVNPDRGGNIGDGDNKIQAYNFRMCLTNNPDNRLEIEKPEGYNEADYEILFRAIEQGQHSKFFKLNLVTPDKTDSNNNSGISTDYNGMNHNYAEADYRTREQIWKAHRLYQQGYVWTIQNHPRVPEEIRAVYKPWGLPLDEFIESGHWSPQLYIRESRRMISDYVVTEHVVRLENHVPDSVGMGSFAMDSHHTQYYINEDGHVSTEGGFYVKLKAPYPISYRALVPKRTECTNLIVPVCVSATHAAYGSIRMEPVFMILGQSAAAAAALALEADGIVQNVKYERLHAVLVQENQVLYTDA
ncbi:FAD dependent oxidoreductase [Paenibacillus sp. UNCCL117]|uniref:FAD-dependent oxidoreductase n=1 Tax=unclassified Paenibacillus TaxID=185978 RepID=UPI00088210ED|nr:MULTISPECIES: FAD-dependent oxidoreductase [unclassified Paenibacillus]SDE43315.1 FAD dependent oxidoreductase [Paenibacillus sp. cl123]SFW45966.1 FAD dependent oxidoreductase [Paenibacillus sp. UNCCL117]